MITKIKKILLKIFTSNPPYISETDIFLAQISKNIKISESQSYEIEKHKDIFYKK
jgi:hypothetical protein